MFRKLVSSLPMSPALAGQLPSYVRRLKKQQAIRRLGLLFTFFALVIQGFVILNPPTQVQASPSSLKSVYSISSSSIIRSKIAINLSRHLNDATKSQAQAGERIQYILHTTNTTASPITTTIEENLADVLEYGTLNEDGGGIFDMKTQTLQWNNIHIAPHSTDTRQLVIQLLDIIPATPRASNNHLSYDCTLTNVYGNTLNIPVACPVSKIIENVISSLPTSGQIVNLAFAIGLLMISGYFYARSRQLTKEAQLLRKELNGGTI